MSSEFMKHGTEQKVPHTLAAVKAEGLAVFALLVGVACEVSWALSRYGNFAIAW